jgi:hypothetical protein
MQSGINVAIAKLSVFNLICVNIYLGRHHSLNTESRKETPEGIYARAQNCCVNRNFRSQTTVLLPNRCIVMEGYPTLCPLSLCHRSLCPLVIVSPDHFVPGHFVPWSFCPPVTLSPVTLSPATLSPTFDFLKQPFSAWNLSERNLSEGIFQRIFSAKPESFRQYF